MDFLSARYELHKVLVLWSLNIESMLLSCTESLLRWSRTRACTRAIASMHLRVIFARFRTLCPLTKACSFTSPLSARRALFAFKTTIVFLSPKTFSLRNQYKLFKKQRSLLRYYQITSESCLYNNSSEVFSQENGRPGEPNNFYSSLCGCYCCLSSCCSSNSHCNGMWSLLSFGNGIQCWGFWISGNFSIGYCNYGACFTVLYHCFLIRRLLENPSSFPSFLRKPRKRTLN